MDNKTDPCDIMRVNLIAAAVGLQQCTKTASNIVPIPGGDRVIAIGTPAQVRAALPEPNDACVCGATAWCDYYTGPVKTHDICAMCDRKRPACTDDRLRLAVREMAAALEAREWAEHVSRDPDAAALELQITELVGLYAAALAKDTERWTKTPPCEQADYWNWDGDPDHAPMIYHVLWSGTAKKCFVSAGQYGIDEAIWCDNFSGWWLKIEQPSIPSTDKAAEEKTGALLTRCAAGRDGECGHAQCPQLRDGEPRATGRHCPLDTAGDEA